MTNTEKVKYLKGYLGTDLRIKNATTEMPLTGAYLDELIDPLWGFDDTYKPILRPLDLTKEIEINGEKFIPIIKLLGHENLKNIIITLGTNIKDTILNSWTNRKRFSS